MKLLKNILIWIIIAFLINFSILWYIDENILNNHIDIKITKINDKHTENQCKNNFNIPKGSKNIKTSFDGKYIAYVFNDSLNIIDICNNKIKKTFYNEKILNYNWTSNMDRILLLRQNKDNMIKLSYYDLNKTLYEDIANLDWVKSKHIKSNIFICPVIDVIYVNLNQNNENVFYSIDLVKNVKKLKSSVLNKICDKKSYKLAGFDENQKIYFYKLKNDLVKEIIYFDNVNQKNFKNLKISNYSNVYDINNLYMMYNGKFYFNDVKNKIVIDLTNNKKFKYNGKFISFYNNGYIYINPDGKLTKQKII